MLTSRETANYFLANVDEDAGDYLSNLKLQKLCYYAQGFHLAIFDAPLFAERIEAWEHGPVVPDLYHDLKKYGAESIHLEGDFDLSRYDAQTTELLDEVYAVYGQFSATKLRKMTHEEPPWKDTPRGCEIPLAAMREYFKTQLSSEATRTA